MTTGARNIRKSAGADARPGFSVSINTRKTANRATCDLDLTSRAGAQGGRRKSYALFKGDTRLIITYYYRIFGPFRGLWRGRCGSPIKHAGPTIRLKTNIASGSIIILFVRIIQDLVGFVKNRHDSTRSTRYDMIVEEWGALRKIWPDIAHSDRTQQDYRDFQYLARFGEEYQDFSRYFRIG